jgi:uncharacterized protein YutD
MQLVNNWRYIVNHLNKEILEYFNGKIDVDIINTDRLVVADKVMEQLRPYIDDYCTLICSNEVTPNYSSMNFPHRFSKGNLSLLNIVDLKRLLLEFINFGFIYHYLNTTFPTRGKVEIDYDNLITHWLPLTLVSNMKLRGYNQEHDKLPAILFDEFYKKMNIDDSMKNDFNIGLFKKSKVYSFFKNIMFSGILLALSHDLETSKF